MMEKQIRTTVLKIADNRAEVRYHLDGTRVAIDGIHNLDHGGIPIQCTTKEGTAFKEVAEECARLIESQELKAA